MPSSFTSTAIAGQHARPIFTRALWLAALLICTVVCAVAQGTPCTGPGAPTTTQTQCVTAILIPGNPLQSFDISFVNPHRAEYYLADRANAGIDVIDTHTLKFKRTIGGFVGIKF